VVVIATLVAPLFIAFGETPLLGKIIPSMLSVSATAATAWLQLRKPQQLWALYRAAHKELEVHYTRFHFRIGEYASADDPDRMLAEQVAKLMLALHYQ